MDSTMVSQYNGQADRDAFVRQYLDENEDADEQEALEAYGDENPAPTSTPTAAVPNDPNTPCLLYTSPSPRD